jgi:hypothetical protein
MSDAPESLNPLKMTAEDYDILSMLRHMDRHIEAKEYETKVAETSATAEKPKTTREKTKTKLPAPSADVAVQQINGRKVVRRIMGDKRMRFTGKAMLHKNDRYIKGKVLNISKSGVFIEAGRYLFRENERVRLYIKPDGMSKGYKSIAVVSRYNNDPRYPQGYGLKFVVPQ